MGRKLNISQPAVIQTELRPLDENFWIDANGSLEQWYYQNTNVFAPDRQVTPLILTPYLSVIDRDTNITYVPNSSNNWVKKVVGQEPEVIPNSSAFQLDHWEVKEYIDGAWVTTTITSQSQNENYVLSGLNLIVRKNNYDATHAITITCKATYNDPRDAGAQHGVQESAMLVTSVDATQAFPKIDIVNPATRTYNPLKDESPVFEFEGKADWDGVEAQGGTAITECKVDPLGTEEILPTNEEMVINAAPTLNIHYGDIEKSDQQFMYRQTANGEVSEIVGGVSAIDNIKGNTVVWNQEIDEFKEGSSLYIAEGSYENGVYIVTPPDMAYLVMANGGVNGHLYYYSFETKGGQISGWMGVNLVLFSEPSDDWRKLSALSTYVAGDGRPFCGLGTNSEDFTSTRYVKNWMAIDLTLMFGAGNEPSTVAEFETWLANNVGLKDYYEYCSGKLVNFGGFGVKWNQLCIDTPESYAGLSMINNADGSITINGTATSPWPQIRFIPPVTGSFNGHKLFFRGINVSGSCTPASGAPTFIIDSVAGAALPITGGSMIVTMDRDRLEAGIYGSSGDVYSNYRFFVSVIDLTLMFGAGNEPDLEWCDKYFSKDYYPYCPSVEKNILDVMTTKESGFNIWDEEWEEGCYSSGGDLITNTNCIRSRSDIRVFPNTEYCFKSGVNIAEVRVHYLDNNHNVITYDQLNLSSAYFTTFTTPNNCSYIRFSTLPDNLPYYGGTYNHDICINVSDPARNGEYEPYHVQYKSPEMGIKTTGFNQWNEELEIGRIYNWQNVDNQEFWRTPDYQKCIGGSVLYAKVFNDSRSLWLDLFFYDGEKNPVGVKVTLSPEQTTAGDTINVPSGATYVRFSIWNQYGEDMSEQPLFCINISDPSKNGTYEPYWSANRNLDWISKIGIKKFNLWDEVWEVGGIASDGTKNSKTDEIRSKNYIPVLPNTTYYWKTKQNVTWGDVHFYDSNKNHISYLADKSNKEFTTPNDTTYILFSQTSQYGTTYNHDICINESVEGMNGIYVPYGETAPYFGDGLKSAGSVHDEIKVEDGVVKAIKRVGSVDLGSLNYSIESASFGSGAFSAYLPNDAHGGNSDVYQRSNIKCSKYKDTSTDEIKDDDKAVALWGSSTNLLVKNTDYSSYSGEQVAIAMQGVVLYYELATPYEFEIDYPTKGQFVWYGVDGSNNEVPIDQLPIYSQATQPSGYGQGTSRININALYGENIPVMLRVKRYPWSPTVLPPKVTKSVAWSVPPIDVITTCDKGSAVRATNSSENFIFGTIVNQQGEIISEEKKSENMVFDWYMVKYGTSGAVKTSQGSGLTKSIPAATLKNTTPNGGVTPSTNVYCEAFLLGAYHLVNGQYVRTKD